ncbi:MAG: class I SAM-dependent methyltransferase [Sporomusaceae bacterium]|nr:class I SAM-dependent methyltransferase [Sporomusaceae bacterium]
MKTHTNEPACQKIGQVVMDYRAYEGFDLYSDGLVEQEMLRLAKESPDWTHVLGQKRDWPFLCHFSPARRNLLEWYDFSPEAKLLEIGAGCGALTGLFCEKVKDVVAVELSKTRAEITAQRHQQCKNLTILVGDLQKINFTEQFDYITLIGVLEYAGKFTPSRQPYLDFLVTVRKMLKPQGKLILAIENKFGLKYWAGAAEDHTGKPFEGVEGYPTSQGIATFGRPELQALLQQAGFTNIDYYYPVPDYKLPKEVYSQAQLPKVGQLDAMTPNYDQDRIALFREDLVYDGLIENNQFEFFANSFLIFAQ